MKPYTMPPHIGYARKHYRCVGCDEIPITPGSVMMTSVTKTGPGKFERAHYCIRCIVAIETKKAHSRTGTVAVAPGSLKLHCLANRFKHAWRDFQSNISAIADGDKGALDKMTHELFQAVGLDFDKCFKPKETK